MTQMIRTAGKAFSVFDAAKLVLTSNDRFAVKFTLAPDAGAKLLSIPMDGSLWLTRDEAVSHLLQSEVLHQFYKTEQIELEEPKGIFTSVAVCGTSGEILGPPNHHSYQTALHKLHRERFSNIPFEDYKRRVRTDNTPEAVEKWKESQKHGTQWVDLKAEVPEGGEAPRFKTRTEMETHFRTHHAPSLIGEATEATVAGNIPRKHLSAGLFNALRHTVEEARKHLLPLAQRLCSSFEHHGLKLFKRRGGKLWVSRTRPRLLDSHITLSDRIAKMVTLIKDKPGISVKDLLSILVPNTAPSKSAPVPAAKTPIAMESPKTESAAEAATTADATGAVESVTEVSTPPPAPAEPAAAFAEPPDERLQALKDLHWLNSEGYIIEYSDGVVFPGVTEPPPAKPKAVKEPAPAATAKAEAAPPATDTPSPAAESIAEEVAIPEAAATEDAEEASEAPAEDSLIEKEEEVSASPAAVIAEEKAPAPPDHSRHMD